MTEIIYRAESYAITGLCFELGLLVNFGHYPKLEYNRIAKTQHIKTKNNSSDVLLRPIRVNSRDSRAVI